MGNSSRGPRKLDGRDLLTNEKEIISDLFQSGNLSTLVSEQVPEEENISFKRLEKFNSFSVSPLAPSFRSLLLLPPPGPHLPRILNIAGTLIRGSVEEKSSLLSEWIFLYSLSRPEADLLLPSFILNFLQTLFTWSRSADSLLHIITQVAGSADSCALRMVWRFTQEDGQSLTDYFMLSARELPDNLSPVSRDTYVQRVGSILEANPVFERMLSFFSILFFLFPLPPSDLLQLLGHTQDNSHPLYDVTTPLLPPVIPKQNVFQSILGPACMSLLACHIPPSLRGPARQLFCSRRDGESFAKLTECVLKKGPTLLVVRDTEGSVFGGFASQSWEINPNFRGDGECFLFTALPKLEVFNKPTFYNNHFMYYQLNADTLPNGLGMGGQFDYFGLWLSADFGKGHSCAKPTCTTYASKQLSRSENFSIHSLEVWGFGQAAPAKTPHMKSALDKDPEARALLELAGKPMHSQGIREPDSSDDEK